MRTDVYQKITDRIVSELERGVRGLLARLPARRRRHPGRGCARSRLTNRPCQAKASGAADADVIAIRARTSAVARRISAIEATFAQVAF